MLPRFISTTALLAFFALTGAAGASPLVDDGAKATDGKDKAAKQAAMLKEYDTNGNGVLDEDEKARMKAERKAKRKENKAKREKEDGGASPKADPPKADPPKADPPKADPPKADPPKADPAKADPPKADPPKADPPKSGGGGGS